jgi:hypothetical protein
VNREFLKLNIDRSQNHRNPYVKRFFGAYSLVTPKKHAMRINKMNDQKFVDQHNSQPETPEWQAFPGLHPNQSDHHFVDPHSLKKMICVRAQSNFHRVNSA